MVTLLFLGGFREQGRSCMVVECRGSEVVIDIGIKKVVEEGRYGAPPWIELVDVDRVEALIVSHLHEDHVAMVPALVRRGYSGPIYMTKPTYELGVRYWYSWARVFEEDGRRIYTVEDVDNAKKLVKTVDYGERIYLKHGYFELGPSGHAIGSALIYMEYGGEEILHLADTRIGSRILPNPVIDREARIVVTNASYGDEVLDDALQTDLFMNEVVDALRNGHVVLIPVTAVGRAQETLAILYENLGRLPKSTEILVHESIRRGFETLAKYRKYLRNDFVELMDRGVFFKDPFTYFTDDEVEDIANRRGSVILAPDLMLMRGASRRVFELLAEKPWLTIIITGYQAPGTLGRTLLERGGGPLRLGERVVDVRARVRRVELKMHLDLVDNLRVLSKALPRDYRAVVLHHGEEPKSTCLALKLYEHLDPLKIIAPPIPSKLYLS